MRFESLDGGEIVIPAARMRRATPVERSPDERRRLKDRVLLRLHRDRFTIDEIAEVCEIIANEPRSRSYIHARIKLAEEYAKGEAQRAGLLPS